MSRNINLVISFVRHAESCGNVGIPYLQDYQKDDPPLSPAGLLQAERLADSGFLTDADRIFSSTLVRAVETAYPTAEKLKKPIILLSDLMENDTEIAGTEISRLERDFPLAVPCTEPTPTGGPLLLVAEGPAERQMRAKRCIDYFFDTAREGEHIMVVTHGSYFGYLIRDALGIGLPESFCWQVDNCSVTRIIFRKDKPPKLSFANYTGHLGVSPLLNF